MAKGGVERGLENLFDGLFSRAFKSSVKPLQIGRRMLQTVDAERDIDAQGRRTVPNMYVVQLSPEDREGFHDLEPSLHQELTEALREYIKQEGYHVNGKARVSLHTNPDLRKGRFDVTAKHEVRDNEGDAAPAESQNTWTPAPPPVPAPALSVVPPLPNINAFDAPPAVLTLPGGQRIELHEGHYSVGRHLECDIVISDSNVSRKHAEIVCADGDVVVKDLGSTNGTKVNGVAVTGEQLLQHGDVIGFGTAQVKFEAS